MIWIHPDDIIIPENRFRRLFNEQKLVELRESIERNGLFHPIVVERGPGDKFTLRAGERRLRVCTAIIKDNKQIRCGIDSNGSWIEMGFVPAIELGELTSLQRLEVEVEENVVRMDFDWKERNNAIAALHELRSKQNPNQTITDTATEIMGKPAEGSQKTRVSNALVIKQHLDIPEVANAKTEKDALKVIRKIAEAGQRAKLAKHFDPSKTPHKLLKGDALELLLTLPDKSIDVVVTDPPYGVDADDFGTQSATGHDYQDSQKNWEKIMAVFPDEAYRVCKDQAHCYVFCDPRNFDRLATLMVLANWTVFPVPMIWVKENGMLPFPDQGPRRTYEAILFAWKGNRHAVLKGRPDVISNIPPVKNLKHGAQKPAALYHELLSRSARPGDSVLDCFGGTGPVFIAANRLRLVATYIERGEDSFNIALTRVNEKEFDDGSIERDGLEDIPI